MEFIFGAVVLLVGVLIGAAIDRRSDRGDRS